MPQACAIVEPRNHPALPLVIFNAFSVLGNDWPIWLFHGTQNKDLCRSLQEEVQTLGGSLSLISLPVPNMTASDYSALLLQRWFWDQIPTDSHILVFQTDSILSEATSLKITDFLRYDYIGAPWPHLPKTPIGNGGLSLRRKSCLLDAITYWETRPSPQLPEDVCFARFLARFGYCLPEKDLAAQFSVERVLGKGAATAPFGIHAAYKKLPKAEWQRLKSRDPLFGLLEMLNGGVRKSLPYTTFPLHSYTSLSSQKKQRHETFSRDLVWSRIPRRSHSLETVLGSPNARRFGL